MLEGRANKQPQQDVALSARIRKELNTLDTEQLALLSELLERFTPSDREPFGQPTFSQSSELPARNNGTVWAGELSEQIGVFIGRTTGNSLRSIGESERACSLRIFDIQTDRDQLFLPNSAIAYDLAESLRRNGKSSDQSRDYREPVTKTEVAAFDSTMSNAAYRNAANALGSFFPLIEKATAVYARVDAIVKDSENAGLLGAGLKDASSSFLPISVSWPYLGTQRFLAVGENGDIQVREFSKDSHPSEARRVPSAPLQMPLHFRSALIAGSEETMLVKALYDFITSKGDPKRYLEARFGELTQESLS